MRPKIFEDEKKKIAQKTKITRRSSGGHFLEREGLTFLLADREWTVLTHCPQYSVTTAAVRFNQYFGALQPASHGELTV